LTAIPCDLPHLRWPELSDREILDAVGREKIASMAFYRFLDRGAVHGRDQKDGYVSERCLLAEFRATAYDLISACNDWNSC
jgi:hypothetical protein